MTPPSPAIAYDSEGEGPPIVLLHGYGMWRQWWKACGYVDALASDHRVIYMDLPGHGESARPHDPDAYAMDRVVESVLRVLDSEGVDQATVWGHGVGGTLAQALVLTGRASQAVIGACTLAVPVQMYEIWAAPLIEEARAGTWTGLNERLGVPPEGLQPVEEVVDLEAVAAYIDGNPWAATLDELQATGVPFLCYHGETDPVFPMAVYQAEQMGAKFAPIAGGLRESFVNSQAVLTAAREFLT